MKKIVILLIAAFALFSFSCNKYCHCNRYIDGKVDKKEYKKGEFVKESQKPCSDYSTPPKVLAGKTEEVKCK
jgi:hypothetical protein